MVVGLGASAGGLEALEGFFDATPPHTGMAFVVVSHQHPSAESLMPELLARHTQMPVVTAQDGMELAPDRVYVTPSTGYLTVGEDWRLRVDEELPGTRRHLPIDRFFRSIGESLQRRAAAVVLSGSGTDGTVGLKAVKSELGLTIAQDPDAAKYAGMPSSAIATRQVDHVLPVDEIAATLVAYAEALEAPPLLSPASERPAQAPDAVRQVLMVVRAHTGHDFSAYKQNTIGRRLERRMNVHRLSSPKDYLELLRSHPEEIETLFHELLIGVTSFFRDPEAFEALAIGPLRRLVKSKPPNAAIRVWVSGCSTGEEAYSIAMLLTEQMEATGEPREVQIFATDIDPLAITTARAGVYPVGIADDVSPERLSRFFVSQDGSYRVSKEIRDMVVFAVHNVLSDPPFTRLDLLSCRNLLIYLDSTVQGELLPVFHYALVSDGVLFIGTAESLAEMADGFDVVDKHWNIYRRKPSSVGQRAFKAPVLPFERGEAAAVRQRPKPSSIFDLSERILAETVVPPSVIVDEHGRIAHIHGRTGRFLEPAPGDPEMNLFQMAREGLRIEVMSALRQATRGSEPVTRDAVDVRGDGETVRIALHVHPVLKPEAAAGYYVVSFQELGVAGPREAESIPPEEGGGGDVAEIERELRATKETLESTVEEYETANEELKSSNEELQSTNEELQSTNEELETAKEEQQSLNEELQTVNAELQEKMETLGKAHDDMRNLLNSTNIATLFLDRDLNIKRYTEETRRVANLIQTDVGRPISDLVTKLDYPSLAEDAREVLDTLESKRAEVRGDNGTWYQMRITPYRTSEDVIDGVVITFVDVTRLKEVEQERERERAAVRAIVRQMPMPALILDEGLRCMVGNDRFLEQTGLEGVEIEERGLAELGPGWDVPELRQLLEVRLPEQGEVRDQQVEVDLPRVGRTALRLDALSLDEPRAAQGQGQRVLLMLRSAGDEAALDRESGS